MTRPRATYFRSPVFWRITAVALVLASAPLQADDLTGAERFLCSAAQVTACYDDGECLTLPPWELNVPEFIEVDLEAGTLSTTEASVQNRSTPIKNLEREDGLTSRQRCRSL